MRSISKIAAFVLMAVVIVVMIAATCIEKSVGSGAMIYGSWWFASLWALLAVSAIIYIFKMQMKKRPVLRLLHISLVLILLGACITHFFGKQGTAHLRLDRPCIAMECGNNHYERFPFELHLESFDVLTYPGTQTPMDYVSAVSVQNSDNQDNKAIEMQISMNRIGEVSGYRFYQMAYDPDLRGTILSVSYDPWGIGVTYLGYALLFLSMLLLLILPSEGFRKALRRLSLVVLFYAIAPAVSAEPMVLPDSMANRFCDLHIYYNGRICPVQTVARDFTTKLYGKPSYNGYSAEQVFTGWVFFPSSWRDEPFKQRKGDRYVEEQQAIVDMLLNGEFLHIYPYPSEQGLEWYSPMTELPLQMDEADCIFIRKSLDYMSELAVTKQYGQLSYTIDKVAKYQNDKAQELLPTHGKFMAEKLYNGLQFTKVIAMVMVTLGLLLFFVYLNFWLNGKKESRMVHWSVNVLMALFWTYQSLVLCLRWAIGGHLPLSNGYETMQFMAWVVVPITLLFQKRFVLMVPFGFLLTGLTLLVSMMGEANPQITPLMPVLSSPLLSIHVCIIMLAYSLLAIVFLNGLTAICLKDKAKVEHLQDVSKVLLYPALFSLAAGIFIGAIWANISWGRYWGWDPKEVWALITMLVYSFVMHSSSLPFFRRPKVFHTFLVLAFLSVLMTYFGVNFILGGMHSYANG